MDRGRENAEGDSVEYHSSLDSSSVFSYEDAEPELESMTAKGVKHLCSELLELREESDDDFNKSIFSSYPAFVRIFEEIKDMENEVMQLKHHISTQKRLIEKLIDGAHLKVLSVETENSTTQETFLFEPYSPSILEIHTNDVSDALDTFLSEHRLDEALAFFEMEAQTFQNLHLEEKFSSDMLMAYNSVVAERRTMLVDQLILEAENPRVFAPEPQKAFLALCRLGNNHLAIQLLLKYYHTSIALGISDFQNSRRTLHGIDIKGVAKFVFSKIFQAANSFEVLSGETCSQAPELMQWTRQETEVFSACFNKYVKSVSERNGGLSATVKVVQFSILYSSLLETQSIALRPCLIQHIYPCMEEILENHIEHCKRVISIFTSSDSWIMGRYLVSTVLTEWSSSMNIDQQPEYYLLTNSGWKLVTLLQTIAEDVSPLVVVEMEGLVLRGLADLFKGYIFMLEKSLVGDADVLDSEGLRINLAISFAQQVSVIANISTLLHFFSGLLSNIFRNVSNLKFEIDNYEAFFGEAYGKLRAHFFENAIQKFFFDEGNLCRSSTRGFHDQGDCFHCLLPSLPCQVLFLEVKKLVKAAEDGDIEMDWLMDLLKGLMESLVVSISSNDKIWTISEGNLEEEHLAHFTQFAMDIRFLVEIAKYEGYLSDSIVTASFNLVSRMKLIFISAGLKSKRLPGDGWAENAATKALQKLQGVEETKRCLCEITKYQLVPRSHSEGDESTYFSADTTESWDDSAISKPEVAISTERSNSNCHANHEHVAGEMCNHNGDSIHSTKEESIFK